LKLVYLYGSYARGQVWIHSDVDIAVLFAPWVDEKDYLDYQLTYIGEVGCLLDFEDVDVQEMNRASVEFQYQVIRDGKVLYACSEDERAIFESKVIEEYLDFKPVLDEYYHHLFKRIKEGRFSAKLPRYIAEVRAAYGGQG